LRTPDGGWWWWLTRWVRRAYELRRDEMPRVGRDSRIKLYWRRENGWIWLGDYRRRYPYDYVYLFDRRHGETLSVPRWRR
jgi:hypothetical protein